MLLNTCSDSELWSLDTPNIPQRSILFNLEPIGIGQSHVESLTSYFTRLADEHAVTASTLLIRQILPHFIEESSLAANYNSIGEFTGQVWALNGVKSRAKDLTKILERLTHRTDLKYLTLLPLSEILNTANQRILRQQKAWCAVCYKDWKETNKVVYEPLLWCLEQVEFCQYHRCLLFEKCPYCGKKMKHLTTYSKPGYCSSCYKWLGDIAKYAELTDLQLSTKPSKWQSYVVESLGDLLITAYQQPSSIDREKLTKSIFLCIDYISQGNVTDFCRLVGLPEKSLDESLRKNTPVQLERLLKICYCLNIPLVSLLMSPQEITETLQVDRLQLPAQSNFEKTITKPKPNDATPIKLNDDDLEKLLKSALEEDPPPLLGAVIARTGYFTSESIVKRFPDLYHQIKLRSAMCVDQVAVRKILEAALEEVPAPVLRNVVERTGHTALTINKYFPDLCGQIKHRQDETRVRRIKRILESSIHEEPPPALTELMIRLGYKSVKGMSSHIKKLFPELCEQILLRHRSYKEDVTKQKREKEYLQIQEISLRLRSEGKPVNWESIKNYLPDPTIAMGKHIRDAIRRVLREINQN